VTEFGAGLSSDTKGAGARNTRPTNVTPRPWSASEKSVGTIIAAALAEGETEDKTGRAEPETIAYYGGIIVCESMRTSDRDYALRAVNEYDALCEIVAVLEAARPFLGMAVANSVGAQAERALHALDVIRCAS
jgi:hypothetical protein